MLVCSFFFYWSRAHFCKELRILAESVQSWVLERMLWLKISFSGALLKYKCRFSESRMYSQRGSAAFWNYSMDGWSHSEDISDPANTAHVSLALVAGFLPSLVDPHWWLFSGFVLLTGWHQHSLKTPAMSKGGKAACCFLKDSPRGSPTLVIMQRKGF